eukprot:15435922-Alexandrium_andersonii.AAC.1
MGPPNAAPLTEPVSYTGVCPGYRGSGRETGRNGAPRFGTPVGVRFGVCAYGGVPRGPSGA